MYTCQSIISPFVPGIDDTNNRDNDNDEQDTSCDDSWK